MDVHPISSPKKHGVVGFDSSHQGSNPCLLFSLALARTSGRGGALLVEE
jgi:hypothetical protein